MMDGFVWMLWGVFWVYVYSVALVVIGVAINGWKLPPYQQQKGGE